VKAGPTCVCGCTWHQSQHDDRQGSWTLPRGEDRLSSLMTRADEETHGPAPWTPDNATRSEPCIVSANVSGLLRRCAAIAVLARGRRASGHTLAGVARGRGSCAGLSRELIIARSQMCMLMSSEMQKAELLRSSQPSCRRGGDDRRHPGPVDTSARRPTNSPTY